MIYTISEICKQVRVTMDENSTDSKLLAVEDTDTLQLDELIKSKIEEGVKAVGLAAPIHMLHTGHNFTSRVNAEGDTEDIDIFWNDNNSGYIILPDDFCRLVSFKMSDWNTAVHTAITPDDPQYQLQSSEFAGIRGNTSKPVVALVMRSVGLTLEFFSSDDQNAIVSESDYLPEPKIDNGGIDIGEKCFKPTIYHIAALVCLTLGNEKLSETLEQVSKSMLI